MSFAPYPPIEYVAPTPRAPDDFWGFADRPLLGTPPPASLRPPRCECCGKVLGP